MTPTASICPQIVERLYAEALALAEAVHARFAAVGPDADGESGKDDEPLRAQLNAEALRTTTRVMHCLGWLVDCRAAMARDVPEWRLRQHGYLVRQQPRSDDATLHCLPADVLALVRQSERLCERIVAIERAWCVPDAHIDYDESAIGRLQRKLGSP